MITGEDGRTRDCRTCLKYPMDPHTEWCPEGTWPLTMVSRAMVPQIPVETANADTMPPIWALLFVAYGVALMGIAYGLYRNVTAVALLLGILG